MTRLVPYLLAFMLPAMVVLGLELGGAWALLPLLFVFGVIPTLDIVIGVDETQPDEQSTPLRRALADLPLLLWIPVQLATTAFVIFRLSSGEPTALELVAAIIGLGIVNGGGGITIAHELVHRKSKLHRAGAELLMGSVHYTHFCIEHVLGHHRNVATAHDPASSRYGESLYRFLPRTLLGSLISAWRLERARCAKQGIRGYSLADRRTRYLLELALVDLGLLFVFGWQPLLLFVAQGVVAFTLLEVINYIEHYGLRRRELGEGRHERVLPKHSWNSAHRVSNWYLFNLARHSDHHYLASREYDRLRHHEAAPQLPTGYAGMVLLALVPRLWFRVMNPRVERWNATIAAPASIEHEPALAA
jgi:alkane 1-monooxygenase